MKTKLSSGYLMALITLFFVCISTFPKNNLFGKQLNKAKSSIYVNPLRLNKKPIDYQHFSTTTTGILSVVIEHQGESNVTNIPFRVYLKRYGEVVTNVAHDHKQPVTEIEIRNVLNFAKPGDWLVIEPTRKEDAAAGRKIQLHPPLSYLFPFLKKEGC